MGLTDFYPILDQSQVAEIYNLKQIATAETPPPSGRFGHLKIRASRLMGDFLKISLITALAGESASHLHPCGSGK